MRGAVLAAAICAAGTAFATPPIDSPRPPSRGESASALVSPTSSPASRAVSPGGVALPASAAAPLVGAPSAQRPPPRPAGLVPAAPEQFLRAAVAVPAPRIAAPGAAHKGALCGIPGLAGRPISTIVSRVSGCGLENGVEVTHVSGIPLSIPAQIDCGTAAALKTWVDRGILPAVGNRGGGVVQIQIAGSYVCRPRNNQAGAKVSEHGRGRAVDLSGIKLRSGEVITVEQGWRGRSRAVLERIHATACGPFGTVLGPNSDRFHHDHIHVDTAENRGTPYCR